MWSHVFLEHSVEWLGYQTVKKFWRYLYLFWQNVRTWQTHRHTLHHHTAIHRLHLHSITRQKLEVVNLRVNLDQQSSSVLQPCTDDTYTTTHWHCPPWQPLTERSLMTVVDAGQLTILTSGACGGSLETAHCFLSYWISEMFWVD